jgi:gas vesicle protein
MSGGKVMLSVLAGVAAGALIGVLLAPDKGSETRRKMMDQGNNYAQNIKNRFNNLVNSFGKKNSNEYIGENEFRNEPAENPVI